MLILETRSEVKVTLTKLGQNQGHSDPKMVHDTPSFKDRFTHKFGIPTSKNIGDMQQISCGFYKLGQVRVTVTQGWYITLRHPKMYPQTKFGIHISNNLRDLRHTLFFLKTRSGQGQSHSDQKMVCDTMSTPDASTHQIWDSFLKKYRRYALGTMPDRR